jgi:hypothetical protein
MKNKNISLSLQVEADGTVIRKKKALLSISTWLTVSFLAGVLSACVFIFGYFFYEFSFAGIEVGSSSSEISDNRDVHENLKSIPGKLPVIPEESPAFWMRIIDDENNKIENRIYALRILLKRRLHPGMSLVELREILKGRTVRKSETYFWPNSSRGSGWHTLSPSSWWKEEWKNYVPEQGLFLYDVSLFERRFTLSLNLSGFMPLNQFDSYVRGVFFVPTIDELRSVYNQYNPIVKEKDIANLKIVEFSLYDKISGIEEYISAPGSGIRKDNFGGTLNIRKHP